MFENEVIVDDQRRSSVDDENLRGKNLHLSEINKNITNIRRPEVVVNQYPDRDQLDTRKKESRFKKVRIMSDSIPKEIPVRDFNQMLPYSTVP